MDRNPFQSPVGDALGARAATSFWRALLRGALAGAWIAPLVTGVLVILAILWAAYLGTDPTGEKRWDFLENVVVTIPMMALPGALVGALFAVGMRWLRR